MSLGTALLVLFALVACSAPLVVQEEPQKIAENFVKSDATYLFDGLAETLKLTSVSSLTHGGIFTYEFDSRHAGYGDRSGEILAQVITHHTAVITVENGKVTSAIMDGIWDMRNNRMREDMEISLAPIHEVNVSLLMSNPPQVAVYIKGGLKDGGTRFHDIKVTREGTTVNIRVTVRRPKDGIFPAVYGYFEKELNLGSDFVRGTTYMLKVNDYTTEFTY